MMPLVLKYENKDYSSLEEMSEQLLHETNEQIIRIDIGEIPNNIESRKYAKFRLMHLQRNYKENIPADVRSMYNSLWSQLYRLEHQDNFKHPYLKKLVFKLSED